MEFKCVDKNDNTTWHGRIEGVIKYGSHFEICIGSRSRIKVLIGKNSQGGFACMPDYLSGCQLVHLNDKFWNTGNLIEAMGEVDGITVGEALYQLSKQGVIPGYITEP